MNRKKRNRKYCMTKANKKHHFWQGVQHQYKENRTEQPPLDIIQHFQIYYIKNSKKKIPTHTITNGNLSFESF